MNIVTYNIHYAIGKDDQYALDRIVDSVRGADVIALQEVERNYGPLDGPSQPEAIASLLPDYYWVYDAAFDIDGSEPKPDGTILNRRRQHGQMILSRWPISSKRYYPLPRINTESEFNMQMGVLEGVVDTPIGTIRVYVVHFGSISSDERQQQAEFIVSLVKNSPLQGGAWTGPASDSPDRDYSVGALQPPMSENAVVLGDFNMQQDSPEYEIITTAMNHENQLVLWDTWASVNPDNNIMTWHPNPSRPGGEQSARLDYCFVTPGLANHVIASRVDEDSVGSDHQPVWLKLESE